MPRLAWLLVVSFAGFSKPLNAAFELNFSASSRWLKFPAQAIVTSDSLHGSVDFMCHFNIELLIAPIHMCASFAEGGGGAWLGSTCKVYSPLIASSCGVCTECGPFEPDSPSSW